MAEPAADHRWCGQSSRGWQVLDRWSWSHRVRLGEGLVVECVEDVVAAAGDLAGDGQCRGGVAGALFDGFVVVVIGRGSMGGAFAGFVECPTQRAWALAGEVTAGAVAVAVIDGDVQASVAHDITRGTEPANVAEFSPDDRGDEFTNAVDGANCLASRLVIADPHQLSMDTGQFGAQHGDHPQRGHHMMLCRWGQLGGLFQDGVLLGVNLHSTGQAGVSDGLCKRSGRDPNGEH